MKPVFNFKRGEFITQNSCPNSFAIFGGEAYDPINPGDGMDYSLICYYNPAHFNQSSEGKWVREEVFEYDLEEADETCEYTINESDVDYWRSCNQLEIDEALKFLAKKHLAWDEKEKEFRKLGVNERIVFGEEPKSTGVTGDNVRHIGHSGPPSTNPYYNRQRQVQTNTRKRITLLVKDDWEQKTPIVSMTQEQRDFVAEQCFKLKYAFDNYGYNGVTIYPTCGGQVPRRVGPMGNEYGYGGMDAYNELMQEQDWWGYCD